ncbi:leucine-rich repeat-containing protein 74A isoform X2 [Tachysurus fulvidraco]|uniref:leucine-rich repeat-containing protein 74A isoform X2 n=1 Tax=Tachysurus fulvidraco TaxID=1234273 RepID=UPI001FEDBADA|nr:leucine-rich repeat-containing protein 74A isoform X2 [Tachysurus fulvidraco]
MEQTIVSLDCLSLAERDRTYESKFEDEWDTETEAEEQKSNTKDMSTAEVYLQACKLLGVVPVSYFLRNLGCATINLNHHGLGPLGGKALAVALVTDTHTTTLELADNFLLAEGARYLVQMLKANLTIQNLDLSDNHFKSAGAEHVTRMLVDNVSIRSLRLSGNGFSENDAKWFAEAFTTNYRVKELDLSHNKFCGRAGEYLGQMLANNEGVEVLNLSWNHLRMKGAVAFSAGLKVNVTLKHLDLSWNGFGNEGALALGEALKFNNTLVFLDLSNNRISDEGVGMLCRGLETNDTLRTLKLAYNSLTVEGALALISVIKNSLKTALEEINICVHYGGAGGFIAKKPPKRPDPMKVIQDYLDRRKLRLWDFFRNIDKDGTMHVSVSDFRKAVQQSNIPLDRFQIEQLIQKLDREGTGMVDYRGLADTRKQMMRDHRRKLRKVESRQKKEKQKSERILKTFQSAVEAVTPRTSIVMSPGGIKEDSSGPQRFSATPLSSWHHIVISNSSRYSVTNMSSEHGQLPMIGNAASCRSLSSPAMHTYSQQNLIDNRSSLPSLTKPASAQGMNTISSKLSPTDNYLTRSRPAINTEQPTVRVKVSNGKKKKSKK